jgi:hypothetical protein
VADDLIFVYEFRFTDGRKKVIDLKLDSANLELLNRPEGPYPEWTRLDFNKCPHCALEEGVHKHCPAAISIITPVDFFRNCMSHEKVEVFIETRNRNYSKHSSLQFGLSSMVGICLVPSGCPSLGKLKPMVRFHLPFATEDETMYRVLSMYLMAQFFIAKNGGKPDWSLQNLIEIYNDISVTNKHLANRLASLKAKDASANAIVNLDCFAMFVTSSIQMNMMEELEQMFKGYLK